MDHHLKFPSEPHPYQAEAVKASKHDEGKSVEENLHMAVKDVGPAHDDNAQKERDEKLKVKYINEEMVSHSQQNPSIATTFPLAPITPPIETHVNIVPPINPTDNETQEKLKLKHINEELARHSQQNTSNGATIPPAAITLPIETHVNIVRPINPMDDEAQEKLKLKHINEELARHSQQNISNGATIPPAPITLPIETLVNIVRPINPMDDEAKEKLKYKLINEELAKHSENIDSIGKSVSPLNKTMATVELKYPPPHPYEYQEKEEHTSFNQTNEDLSKHSEISYGLPFSKKDRLEKPANLVLPQEPNHPNQKLYTEDSKNEMHEKNIEHIKKPIPTPIYPGPILEPPLSYNNVDHSKDSSFYTTLNPKEPAVNTYQEIHPKHTEHIEKYMPTQTNPGPSHEPPFPYYNVDNSKDSLVYTNSIQKKPLVHQEIHPKQIEHYEILMPTTTNPGLIIENLPAYNIVDHSKDSAIFANLIPKETFNKGHQEEKEIQQIPQHDLPKWDHHNGKTVNPSPPNLLHPIDDLIGQNPLQTGFENNFQAQEKFHQIPTDHPGFQIISNEF